MNGDVCLLSTCCQLTILSYVQIILLDSMDFCLLSGLYRLSIHGHESNVTRCFGDLLEWFLRRAVLSALFDVDWTCSDYVRLHSLGSVVS